MKKVLVIVLACMIVVALTACSTTSTDKKTESSTSSNEDVNETAEEETKEINENFVSWPSGGLFAALPKPESDKVVINYQSDEYFDVKVYDISQDDYTKYVGKLRDMGYKDREDKQIAEWVFNAVDPQGYEIMSSVDDVDKIMYIQFKSPDSTLKF